MTRALKELMTWWRCVRTGGFFRIARPTVGYCDCCGVWTWRTSETPAYSSPDVGAWLCEDCADENDRETDAAWRDYYAGRL